MNKEERDLMITMAKTVDSIKDRLEKLEQPMPSPFTAGPINLPFLNPPRLVQTIENENQLRKAKMQIVFAGAEGKTYDIRMKNCEDFLRDLIDLINDYQIVSLSGTYGPLPEAK